MTDQTDLDGPVARHLARTLQEVAATTPVSDRRDAIASRLPPAGAEHVTPVGDAPHRPGHRRGRMVTALAVAAVALVVVALATVAIRRGDDGAVDLRPVEDPGRETGWYLPGEGWTVTAATAERRFEGAGVCPCTTINISETGDDPAALVVWEGAADQYEEPVAGDGAEAIDVGGRPGTVRTPTVTEVPGVELDEAVEYVVHAGDSRLVASSQDVDEAVVVDVLDAWSDRLDADEPVRREDLPIPEGMEASVPRTKTWSFDHEVFVHVRNDATGEALSYQLVPTGGYVTLQAVLDSERTTFEDDVFTVRTRNGPEDLLSVTHAGGPVDIVAGVGFLGGPEVADDVVTALDASLHPVDTAAWRAALDPITADVDPALLTAPTLLAPPLTG